ncbi:hypothetical protein GW17_00054818, partial [Ensete ventricosum]
SLECLFALRVPFEVICSLCRPYVRPYLCRPSGTVESYSGPVGAAVWGEGVTRHVGRRRRQQAIRIGDGDEVQPLVSAKSQLAAGSRSLD